jgi:type IV pilus assembly protein PilP
VRRTVLLALAAAALACSQPTKPAAPPARPPAAPAAPAPVAGPEQPATPEWSYSSVGKRDPFRSFLAESSRSASSLSTRCATPLGRYEIEQLKLVAVVTGLEDPVAMVETPGGTGFPVRRGACIGKNGGTVAAIRSGEIVVAEWASRADGTRDRTQTILSLPKREPLILEEQP